MIKEYSPNHALTIDTVPPPMRAKKIELISVKAPAISCTNMIATYMLNRRSSKNWQQLESTNRNGECTPTRVCHATSSIALFQAHSVCWPIRLTRKFVIAFPSENMYLQASSRVSGNVVGLLQPQTNRRNGVPIAKLVSLPDKCCTLQG